MAQENQSAGGKGYGKRPLWQWIVLYVVIGGLVYFAVYYFFLKGQYSENYEYTGQAVIQQQTKP